jgi:probable DNA repair protein
MAAVLFDIEPLREALERGTLVLTANNRQRNQIMRAYHQYQSRQNAAKAWRQPRIFSLRQWTEQQWQALLLSGKTEISGTIANSWQSLSLWEQVIAANNTVGRLLRQRELASTAESARQSLDAWCCPIEELVSASAHRPNAATFMSWLTQYRQILERHQLVSQEQAQQLLLTAFINNELPPEQGALLYGFDELAPLAQRLLAGALPDAEPLKAQQHTQTIPVRVTLTDFDAEVRAAAHWADNTLATNPDAVIGIVVPNLGQQRTRVERIFKEVFEPLACQPGKARTVAPFNFSSGTPLGAAPVIRTALDWLALALQAQPVERVCRLLANNFWGDCAPERSLRAALAQRIRRTGRQKISIANLRYMLEQLTQQHPELESELSRRLQIASEIERERHHKHSLPQWLDRAMEYLDQLGWPGTRPLDSVEYQQIKQWYELHDELLSLSQVQPLFSLYEVTDLLRRSADKTHFQAQTPDSPIQILGALEASGLNFTHCWVLGMNHRAWPPAPAPNPLLPINLQRDWQMPNASAERELLYAERLTNNFKHCATQVVFSHGASADDQPLKPSSLIAGLTTVAPQALGIAGQSMRAEHYRALVDSARLEAVDCRRGPTLTDPAVRGGAGLFKAQASCPFIAFARFRLGAHSPSEPTLGFSAIERGNVLHDALASVWQQLQNSINLGATTEGELQTLVTKACSDAVSRTGKARGAEIGAMFRDLEAARLTQLLLHWLSFERERGPFIAQEIETQHTIRFAGLELTVRVDRIDRLEGDGQLIIDYKTGQVNTASWRADNLSDPQLPLYACTLAPGGAQAIAFAQINASDQRFAGLGYNTVVDGIDDVTDEQWAEQLDEWQQRLTELAQEFRDGWASVDYRNKNARAYDQDFEGLTRADELADISHWLKHSGVSLP